ncbi:type IV toxin-antitoxin system AbiEi family antitoxin domain-containing protein [Geminisphaera colitermitum]|uniref:type IV toxin-antitoxin system AbiEi family antitoxin domain-containing protein n=1 Tax=Geminisphaera colitermitum TaxID=1148786 RepID=UPI000158CCF4|nr:hypothetical protein [Geminisphaera colitermitum]
MNQMEALQRIRALGVAGFATRDVAALLKVSPANASVILSRLARGGFVQRLARGHWTQGSPGGREVAAEQLAAPFPAYVSLQSALFRHGLIEQIPAVLYVATLGRARRVSTPLGAISFHRLPAELFGGFETTPDGAKMATAEKALFDLLYLAPTRSRLFATLPEVEFPRTFRWHEAEAWTARIAGKSRRIFVEQKLAVCRFGKKAEARRQSK